MSCCQPPASSIACAPPDAGRAVEVEEPAGAIAAAVLEDEMAVEQDGLDSGEQRIVAVDMAPARLDHPDAGIGEMRHQPRQEVGGRDEVGVEDRDELAARGLQPGLERAGLVPAAVQPMDVLDVDPFGGPAPHRLVGDVPGLVGRVVEHLDFQQLARVVDSADGVDQPVGDVHLVVKRQLNRYNRKGIERRASLRLPVLVSHVEVDKVVPMPTVNGEDNEHEEVDGEGERFSGCHGSDARRQTLAHLF